MTHYSTFSVLKMKTNPPPVCTRRRSDCGLLVSRLSVRERRVIFCYFSKTWGFHRLRVHFMYEELVDMTIGEPDCIQRLETRPLIQLTHEFDYRLSASLTEGERRDDKQDRTEVPIIVVITHGGDIGHPVEVGGQNVAVLQQRPDDADVFTFISAAFVCGSNGLGKALCLVYHDVAFPC